MSRFGPALVFTLLGKFLGWDVRCRECAAVWRDLGVTVTRIWPL